MKSLFFRTYLSVIAFAVITFILIVYLVLNPALEREEWEYVQLELEDDYQLITDQLNKVPKTEWHMVVESQQEAIDKVAKLVDLANVVDDKHRERLSESEQANVISSLDDNPWYGKFRVPDSDKVLVIIDKAPLLATQEGGVQLADENVSIGFVERLSFMTAGEKFEMFAPLLLVSLAQLFGVILLVRLIKSPIDQLTKKAEQLGDGDFSVRADTAAPEPLGRLAFSFNSMAQRVEQSMQEKEMLIAAIPHELQTPLSRMRFLLELSHKKQNSEELRATITDLDENVSELELAVQEILQLTRIKNARSSHMDRMELLGMLELIADYYNHNGKLRIGVSCAAQLQVFAHHDLLNRAVHNLVQNAEKYANSECKISGFVRNKNVVLSVEDDGAGIPVDKRAEMLNAFARLDSSRNSSTGGLGLGLALVKAIMDVHAGSVTIGESALGGASIQLTWPQLDADLPRA